MVPEMIIALHVSATEPNRTILAYPCSNQAGCEYLLASIISLETCWPIINFGKLPTFGGINLGTAKIDLCPNLQYYLFH
jgi:hypothetical protein